MGHELHYRRLTENIIGCAIEVHRILGAGLLESAYSACLYRELVLRQINVEREVAVSLRYKGHFVECSYRADLVVEGTVLVELKAVETLQRVHEAQVLTYLRLMKLPVGLLFNFNVTTLRHGLRRFVI